MESELKILILCNDNRREAAMVNAEMKRAREHFLEEYEGNEKLNHKQNEKIEIGFQLTMLLQSFFQSMILLILARNSVMLFGFAFGSIVVILMWLPTELMTAFVTPRLLAQISLSNAFATPRKAVLEQMIEEATGVGDYAAAGEVLEVAMLSKLTTEQISDEELCRAKVQDLLKLGELKWRYRVVEEGRSPRDEAVLVLEEAEYYIMEHIFMTLEASQGKPRADIDEGHVAKHKEEMWAEELSECCQGLALARLIFNQDREEDELIYGLLMKALALRESIRNKLKIADTHNSLGSLAQKQKNYLQAESAYKKSLNTRLAISPVTEKEQSEKEQACAQSYTSLGNLYLEMEKFQLALDNLSLAKESYIKGFHETHTKVAWALEAQANVHRKMKNLRAAQACVEEAIGIRRSAQAEGKELFSKELEKNEKTRREITAERDKTRQSLKLILKESSGGKTPFAGRMLERLKANSRNQVGALKAAGLTEPLIDKQAA